MIHTQSISWIQNVLSARGIRDNHRVTLSAMFAPNPISAAGVDNVSWWCCNYRREEAAFGSAGFAKKVVARKHAN